MNINSFNVYVIMDLFKLIITPNIMYAMFLATISSTLQHSVLRHINRLSICIYNQW